MLLISCPHCGDRAQTEFTYRGDARLQRPDPATASQAQWLDYIYFRDNPCGPHIEWWQHSSGCRQWIKVKRNVQTHEVLGSASATGDIAGEIEETSR